MPTFCVYFTIPTSAAPSLQFALRFTAQSESMARKIVECTIPQARVLNIHCARSWQPETGIADW